MGAYPKYLTMIKLTSPKNHCDLALLTTNQGYLEIEERMAESGLKR